MTRTLLHKIKKILSKTWQFFASVIVVFVVFLSEFHDFKSPSIAIEITAVNTTSSQPIDIIKYPEISAIKNIIEREYFTSSLRPIELNRSYSPDEIDRILLVYGDTIEKNTKEIDRINRILGEAISESNKKEEIKILSSLLDDIISDRFASFVNPVLKSKVTASVESDEQVSEKLRSNIKYALENKTTQRNAMSAKHRAASEQWLEFKLVVIPSRTKLVVTCAIGNQGSGATSLKPQALFRANLGEGNYLDFPMKMSDYDSSPEAATLQPRSYKVLKFESDEIQFMTASDRDRFKLFLGNASPAKIFISDVRGDIYSSNSAPFSPGIYEQKMFDSLKQFASSKKLPQQK